MKPSDLTFLTRDSKPGFTKSKSDTEVKIISHPVWASLHSISIQLSATAQIRSGIVGKGNYFFLSQMPMGMRLVLNSKNSKYTSMGFETKSR